MNTRMNECIHTLTHTYTHKTQHKYIHKHTHTTTKHNYIKTHIHTKLRQSSFLYIVTTQECRYTILISSLFRRPARNPLRTIQVVVWFLVHCLHQITAITYFSTLVNSLQSSHLLLTYNHLFTSFSVATL